MKQIVLFSIFIQFSIVSFADRYTELDNYVFHSNSEKNATNTTTLANYFESVANNDFEKAYLAHRWTSSKIKYDLRYTDIQLTAQETLDSRVGVCFHYAILFKELAQKMGLRAVLVGGISRIPSGKLTKPQIQSPNHIWNSVKIEGIWYLLDATNEVKGRYISRTIKFLVKPSEFIKINYPELKKWQLLQRNKYISFEDFRGFNISLENYDGQSVVDLNNLNGSSDDIIMTDDLFYEVDYNDYANKHLIGKLYYLDSDKEVPGNYFFYNIHKSNKISGYILLPQRGTYIFKLLQHVSNGRYEIIDDFIIQSTHGKKNSSLNIPQRTPNADLLRVHLRPKHIDAFIPGEEKRFSIYSDKIEAAVLLFDGDRQSPNNLTKKKNNNGGFYYSIKVKIPSQAKKAEIFVRKQNSKKYIRVFIFKR